MNLNYLVNYIPSHHSRFNLFVVADLFFRANITLYLNFEHEKLTNALYTFALLLTSHNSTGSNLKSRRIMGSCF